MSIASSFFTKGVVASIVFFLALLFVVGTYAEAADLRDRGSTGRTVDLTPAPIPTPTPDPTPSTPTPPVPSGGITNVTIGEVDTGSNTGGEVTTGDESVDVHEVNVGPVNDTPPTPPPTMTPTPEPEPESQCDVRDRLGCVTQGPGRTR